MVRDGRPRPRQTLTLTDLDSEWKNTLALNVWLSVGVEGERAVEKGVVALLDGAGRGGDGSNSSDQIRDADGRPSASGDWGDAERGEDTSS